MAPEYIEQFLLFDPTEYTRDISSPGTIALSELIDISFIKEDTEDTQSRSVSYEESISNSISNPEQLVCW